MFINDSIDDSRFPSIKIFLSDVIFSFILFWYSVLSIFGSPEKRETSNSRHVADYDSAVHRATTMKRKTIKRTGQLFFPIDINDIQSEVEISSESNHETPSLICANDTVSNVIPDHDYHTFWATPNSASSDFTTQTVDLSTSSFSTQTTDIEISVDDKSFQTTFDSRSVGVQVDTFSCNTTNLSGIHMRQQQRLVHDLKLKVKNLTSENQHLKQQTFCVKKTILLQIKTQDFILDYQMFLLSKHYLNILNRKLNV